MMRDRKRAKRWCLALDRAWATLYY